MKDISCLIGESVKFVRRSGSGCIADSAVYSGESGIDYFIKT